MSAGHDAALLGPAEATLARVAPGQELAPGEDRRRAMEARRHAAMRQGVVAALDIGSSKICCMIARIGRARLDGDGGPAFAPAKVIGVGHQLARGVRAGAITDLDEAVDAIRHAVDNAERMADVTIDSVIVNVSGGALESRVLSAEVAAPEGRVREDDLAHAHQRALDAARAPGRDLIHAHALGYEVDGEGRVADPRGLVSRRLGVELAALTVSSDHARNLEHCIARCHLELAGLVASPFASGLAALVEDELDMGCACIDMGGGTTSIAVFHKNRMIFSDVVRIGGDHITNDIAQGLSTPRAHAERMKTLFGSALASPKDDREMIDVPQLGEDHDAGPNYAPRSMLTGVIKPRLEETLEFVRDHLRASGVADRSGVRLVLTGGASQLTGADQLAARILDKKPRLAGPQRLAGLADAMAGPAFSTCAGLVAYALEGPEELYGADRAQARGGRLAAFKRWLATHF